MNTLDFDKSGSCILLIDKAANDTVFLGNNFFDNSIAALKCDIELCEDTAQKSLLTTFLYQCKTDNIFNEDDKYTEETSTQNFNVGFNDDSSRYVTVHNIDIKHSGFWYAAFNIGLEIENQKKKKHINEGLLKFSEGIENVISCIRNANCYETAVHNILQLGFTEAQAKAIFNFPMNHLTSLREESIRDCISRCEQIITFLLKLDI